MGSNIRRRQQTCITREQAEEEQRRAVRAHGELNTALGQAGYAARAAAGGERPCPCSSDHAVELLRTCKQNGPPARTAR